MGLYRPEASPGQRPRGRCCFRARMECRERTRVMQGRRRRGSMGVLQGFLIGRGTAVVFRNAWLYSYRPWWSSYRPWLSSYRPYGADEVAFGRVISLPGWLNHSDSGFVLHREVACAGACGVGDGGERRALRAAEFLGVWAAVGECTTRREVLEGRDLSRDVGEAFDARIEARNGTHETARVGVMW